MIQFRTASAVLGLLVWAAGAAAQAGSLRQFAEASTHRQAYGVYIGGAKVGWAVDELKLGRHRGKRVAIETFEMRVNTTMAGIKVAGENRSALYYDLDGNGTIVHGHETRIEDQKTTSISAERDGRQLRVAIQSPADHSQRRVPIPRETLKQMQNLDRWLRSSPKPGARFVNYTTAWDREDINVKETMIYQGKRPLIWGGVPTEIHQVQLESDGALIQCEISDDGTLIKGTIGGFMELRAEKEAVARDPNSVTPVDMLAASAIAIDRDLGDPEKVRRLVLEVGGLENFTVPASARQRITVRRGAISVLEVLADQPLDKPEPLSPPERARHLQPAPNLQIHDPKIRRLATEIIGEQREPLRIAERLKKWVHQNLRQTMGANSSSALEVLEAKAGDCTEHALLFVALARAAGLPAREVGGIVFGNEDRPLFGWHAWAEIHDGRQWVSVDPTWNQLFVDATHIKLAEGADDWAWINLLGKLRLSVVEVDTRD